MLYLRYQFRITRRKRPEIYFLQWAQKCIKPALMPQIKNGAFFNTLKNSTEQ